MKKSKLIGLDTVKQELINGNHRKIVGLATNKKLEIEAARYLLSRADNCMYNLIIENYSFSEVFDSFADFFKGAAAEAIARNYDIPVALKWFDTFFDSSEELISTYNSLDEKTKRCFSSYLCNRNFNESDLRVELRDKYINCIEGVTEIFIINNGFRYTDNVLQRIFINLPYIGKDAIDRIIEHCKKHLSPGQNVDMKLIERCLERRYDEMVRYMKSKERVQDMLESFKYLPSKKIRTRLLSSCLYHFVEEYHWNDSKDSKTNEMFEIGRWIYTNHLRELFLDDEFSREFVIFNHSCDNFKGIFLFEEDSAIKDRFFSYLGKCHGFNSFLRVLVRWHTGSTRGMITPTKKMTEVSLLVGCCETELILNKELTKADEILEFFHKVLPSHKDIPYFHNNRFLYENIRLENLPQEEYKKVEACLDMGYFEDYFKGSIVPFKILVNNDKLFTKKESAVRFGIRSSYSVKEMQWLLDNKRELLSDNIIQTIGTYGVKKGEKAEEVANLIKTLGESDLSCCTGIINQCEVTSLDLREVLTYIN